MLKRFVFAREDQPGVEWMERFATGRQEAEGWYLGKSASEPTGKTRGERPTGTECKAALLRYMPELASHYEHACELVGNDEIVRCILSHYRPPPAPVGCSIAIWSGAQGPAFIRNYDFRLDVVSDRFEMANWSGRRVICKAQRPWGGCVDGMNEDGLAAAVTCGGSPAQGLGFAIILVLRYVLETCSDVGEAISALCRIPVAMSHNVMLLDRTGAHAAVYLGPDRAPCVTPTMATTNHQETIVWPTFAAGSATVERLSAVEAALADPGMTLPRLVTCFLSDPIYSRRMVSPTVYTAVYRPADNRVDYLWPGRTWSQGFDSFKEGEYVHDYGELI